MANVKLNDLQSWLMNTLTGLKMTQENAELVTDTVMRATLRGVGHHDIYDFPGRLNGLLEGKYPPNPDFQPIASFKTMESWDGGNGLGELICSFAMERAMKLADEYGIGLCAMRNSNHYMAAAPYVERASERGYIALLLCKGTPTMGAPGRTEKVVGTLPMGFAVPTDHGYPIMLDACMAYASFGVLKAHMDSCTPVPAYWGFDKEGNPTTDPAAMAQGTRLPIGGHKGFGLAVLGEVLLCPFVQGKCIQPVMRHHKAVDYILRNRFNVDVRIGNTAPVTILHLLPKGKTTEDVAANLFPFAHTFHKCLIIREFHKQLLLPRYSVAVKSVSSSDNSIS